MNKHTPGPWEALSAGHGNSKGFVIDEYFVLNREVSDDVAICTEIIDPSTQMPSIANALLIAAAPDLLMKLSALIAAAEYLQARVVETRGANCMDNLDAAIDEAKAAIHKATVN